MTHPRTRVIAIVSAAALAVASMGCGLLRSARNITANAATLGDLSDKLTKASTLTFQAQYKLDDGTLVTVAQKPPNSAAVGAKGRFITTADSFYLCDTEDSGLVCQKSPRPTGDLSASDAGLAASVAGAGFISGPMALVLLTAAIVIPSAKVAKSTTKIAGQSSTCATVSNLESAQQGDATKLTDFTVCVTDNGVLSRFSGHDTDGKKAGVEMVQYSSTVDDNVLSVPADATINDAGTLGLPSAAPSSDGSTGGNSGGTDSPSPSDGSEPSPQQS